ncbi:GumC family protein [Alteromonas oceanisediminis]|uniref:GumC family protein n=1 Tax=Alteromonas oceanisediminis TaxID=2836180 RepID=UPI001BD9E872|nr:polysaccharide biosynthesis tyrosine autokinase [Alteromonas oceanisediminis]MBT0587618.1 polysaccharide biosynthesis tyrosine autokinase [Alteromonas oceanisediminis]
MNNQRLSRTPTLAPTAAEPLNAELLDIDHYWQLVKRNRFGIATFALFFTAVTALVLLFISPRYIATASLLIEAEQTKLLSIEEVYGMDSSRKEYYQTQFEILKSRKIAALVVDKLNLVEHPLLDPQNDSESAWRLESVKNKLRQWLKANVDFLPKSQDKTASAAEKEQSRRKTVVSRVMKDLTIKPITNTQVVEIKFESESPKLAAAVANAVAESYIDSYLDSKLEMTNKATSWLNQSITGLREKLNDSEQALSDFYQREQVVDIDGVMGLAADELQQLSDQLTIAQNEYKKQGLRFDKIAQFNGDTERFSDYPEIVNNATIQGIKQSEAAAQSRLSELSNVYGPKHPTLISAKAELASIQANLRNEMTRVVSSLSLDQQSKQDTISRLKEAVNAAKARYRELTQLENTRQTLLRNVEVNRQLYDSFFTRMKETAELGGFESANARILDAANPPRIPAKPKKTLLIAGALIFSAGLAIFLVIAADALSSGIRSPNDVEKKLGQRLLGAIPKQKRWFWQPKLLDLRLYFATNANLFGEAFRSLRTNLRLLEQGKSQHVIMLTSALPKEGKTTTAINMSFSLGQLGSVILIDADLRRGDIGRRFGLVPTVPGLSELLSKSCRIDECIITDEDSGIDLISAGSNGTHPQEMLASSDFRRLIDALKKNYDYVIIDTPPTRAVADSMVVSALCDTTLFVVKADSTDAKHISRSIDRFEQLNQTVDGIILTQFDPLYADDNAAYYGITALEQYSLNKPGVTRAGANAA